MAILSQYAIIKQYTACMPNRGSSEDILFPLFKDEHEPNLNSTGRLPAHMWKNMPRDTNKRYDSHLVERIRATGDCSYSYDSWINPEVGGGENWGSYLMRRREKINKIVIFRLTIIQHWYHPQLLAFMTRTRYAQTR